MTQNDDHQNAKVIKPETGAQLNQKPWKRTSSKNSRKGEMKPKQNMTVTMRKK